MAWVKVTRILDRDEAISGLVRLREEWQEVAEGMPLAEVTASVGLLMADMAGAVGLLPEEVARVLGNESISDPAKLRLLA